MKRNDTNEVCTENQEGRQKQNPKQEVGMNGQVKLVSRQKGEAKDKQKRKPES